MSELTRRGFVKNSAGVAAAMSGIAALLAEQAEAHPATAGREPVVAYIGDASTGEISVMSADRELTLHDPQLASRIAGLIR